MAKTTYLHLCKYLSGKENRLRFAQTAPIKSRDDEASAEVTTFIQKGSSLRRLIPLWVRIVKIGPKRREETVATSINCGGGKSEAATVSSRFHNYSLLVDKSMLIIL